MKTSEENVLEKPASAPAEPYLLIGSAFESKGSVLAAKVPARGRARPNSAGTNVEGARHLRVWAREQLAETQTAEGLVFQLLLASGVVLILISFWL
jgi:hypothetical protein